MAQIYEIELPDGRVVEYEGDKPPDATTQRKILAAALPKYSISDISTPDDPRFNPALANRFSKANVGDELEDPASGYKFIKASDHEYVAPKYEFEQSSTALGSAARAAGLGLPAAAAGARAFGATANATKGLTPYFSIPASLLAGGGAAVATQLAQNKLLEKVSPDTVQQEQLDAQRHPNAVVAGSVASNLPFFGVGKLAPTLGQEALKRAIPAAIGGGVQAGQEIYNAPEGQLLGEGAGSRIGIAALGNALLNEPTKLGNQFINGAIRPKSIITQLDNVTTKQTPAQANAEANKIALGANGADIAEAGDPARLTNNTQFGADVAHEPDDISNMVANYREKADQVINKKFDDVVANADALTSQGLHDNLKQLGLDAESHAKAFEELNAATNAANDAEELALLKLKTAPGLYADELKADIATGNESFRKNLSSLEDNAARLGDAQTRERSIAARASDVETALSEAERTRRSQLGSSLLKQDLAEQEFPVNYAGAKFQGTVGEWLGNRVEYAGYKGKLIQEPDGKISIVRENVTDGTNPTVEIEGSGKSLDSKIADVGVNPVVQDNAINAPPEKPLTQSAPPTTTPVGEEPRPTTVSLDDEDAIAAAAEAQAKRRSQAGFITPGSLVNLSAPVAGATVGYQFGDTPEERRKNALLGALVASGGVLSARATQSLYRSNPAFFERLAQGFRDAHALNQSESRGQGGNVFDQFTNRQQQQDAVQVQGPEGLPIRQPSENSQTLGENLRGQQEPAPEGQETQVSHPAPEVAGTSLDNPIPGYQYTQTLSRWPFFEAVKNSIGLVSTNIRAANPRIFGVLQKYELALHSVKKSWAQKTAPLGQLVRQTLNPEDFGAFNRAVLSGDLQTASRVLDNYPNAEAMKSALELHQQGMEEIRRAQVASGREVPGLEGYFPRKIVDYDQFLAGMDREEQGILDKLFKQAAKAKGTPLTTAERDDIVNGLVEFSSRGGGKPGYLKSRTISAINERLEQFYEPFDVSTDNYVNRASRDLVNREFFGKFDPSLSDAPSGDLGGNFGEAINKEYEQGRLNPASQKIVLDNLKARFTTEIAKDDALAKMSSAIRQATSLAFLGDLTTSIAQFGDVIMTMRRYGLADTVQGYLGKNKKPLSEIIHTPDEDLVEYSKAVKSGKFNILVRNVLDKTIGKADRFNKDGSLNAAWSHLKKAASNQNSKEFRNLNSKYETIYGDEWRQKMLPDLAAGRLTDESRLIMFNELSEMQPISPSEMPPAYNKSTAGKLLYSLKSYWLKQLDIVRREGYEMLKSKATFLQGAANLGTYALAIGAQGFAIDYTRDVLLGRTAQPGDYLLANLMRVFGLSRYQLYKAKQDGPAEAFLGMVFPFAQVMKDGYTDYRTVVANGSLNPEDLEAVKYIPFAGRFLYWQYGKGAQKMEKQKMEEMKGKAQPTTLEAIKDMINPQPPAHPRK